MSSDIELALKKEEIEYGDYVRVVDVDGECICQGFFDDNELDPSEELGEDDEPLWWSDIIYILGERFDVPRSQQIDMHDIDMTGYDLQVWVSNEPEKDEVLARAQLIAEKAVVNCYRDVLQMW